MRRGCVKVQMVPLKCTGIRIIYLFYNSMYARASGLKKKEGWVSL